MTPTSTACRRSTIVTSVCSLVLVVGLVSSWLLTVHQVAAGPTTTVAVGESNNEIERAELLDLFGVDDSEHIITITVDETLRAWEDIFDLSGVDSAYSSVALTCNPPRSGIDVTTSNIEIIPPDLYALTLVTAGLNDASLVVAAPSDAPALGMTALTGIFRAWDQSPCASADHDPARRQLALRQLALVADIGQAHGGAEAVGSATDLVLSLQQDVVSGQTDPGGLDAMVTARSDQLGFPLADYERGAVVDFFGLMLNQQPDWGGFADTWRVDHVSNGTRVLMRPGEVTDPSPTARALATGVGGQTGPLPTILPTATATATAPPPTNTPRVIASPSATATSTLPAAVGPTDIGGPSAGESSDGRFPWWVLLGMVPLALGIFFLARRRRRAPLIARRVSPFVAAAAVARRRSTMSTTMSAGPGATTSSKVPSRRRFTLMNRPERPATPAPSARRVIDPNASGD